MPGQISIFREICLLFHAGLFLLMSDLCKSQNFAGGAYDGNGMALLRCGNSHVFSGGSYDGSNRAFLLCGVSRTVSGSSYDGNAVARLLCGAAHTFKGGPYDGTYRNVLTCGSPRVYRGGSCSGDYFQLSFCTGETYTLKPCVSSILLPIELLSFAAQCAGGMATITWETASEKNNAEFYVERALSSVSEIREGSTLNWEVIGRLRGAGNSNFRNAYSFIDDLRSPLLSMASTRLVYYRLRQKDFDGTEKTFFPAVIHYPCSDNIEYVFIFPSPGSGQLNLSGSTAIQRLEILNAMGQRVFSAEDPANSLNLGFLSSGIYFLTAVTAAQEKYYYKFCISK